MEITDTKHTALKNYNDDTAGREGKTDRITERVKMTDIVDANRTK